MGAHLRRARIADDTVHEVVIIVVAHTVGPLYKLYLRNIFAHEMRALLLSQ